MSFKSYSFALLRGEGEVVGKGLCERGMVGERRRLRLGFKENE